MPNRASATPAALYLELPSQMERLEEVVDQAEAFAAAHVADDDLVYRIVLVTTEAVTNAMEHGNRMDAHKKVEVRMEAEAAQLIVWVRDEGRGFDRATVKDPLAEENLLQEGGRGLYLIETLADEVRYEDSGRCMRMVFHT